MEQQLHDKSETFKIIYKALLLQIILMEFKKVNWYEHIYIFSNLISLHLAYLFWDAIFLSHASIMSIAASEWITHLDVTSKTLQRVIDRRSSKQHEKQ